MADAAVVPTATDVPAPQTGTRHGLARTGLAFEAGSWLLQ